MDTVMCEMQLFWQDAKQDKKEQYKLRRKSAPLDYDASTWAHLFAFAEFPGLLKCTHSKLLLLTYHVSRWLSNTNFVYSRFGAPAESEERKHSAAHRLGRRLRGTLRGRYDAGYAALA